MPILILWSSTGEREIIPTAWVGYAAAHSCRSRDTAAATAMAAAMAAATTSGAMEELWPPTSGLKHASWLDANGILLPFEERGVSY